MLSDTRALAQRHSDDLVQFAGYAVVSAGAFVVDVAVYSALLEFTPYAFAAAAGGYVFGVAFHYLLSSRVVFRTRFHKRGLAAEAPTLAKFFAAGFMGLIVTMIVVGVLADGFGINPLVAKVCAAACSFAVVFLGLRLFVFKPALTTTLHVSDRELASPAG